MKPNLNSHHTSLFVFAFFVITFFSNCKGSKAPDNKDSVKKAITISQPGNKVISDSNTDSLELTMLIKNLYKWHEIGKMKYAGFKPLKRNATDTLYTNIDLEENKKAINELDSTGLFTKNFLDDYHKIAVRMDKELQDGSSLWPKGELSTFGDDADAWCNCQDSPVDNYWTIIKLANITINNNEATFKWTWGDNFYYKAKATKENGHWKISYLQGFDMNAYSWEWRQKNKK